MKESLEPVETVIWKTKNFLAVPERDKSGIFWVHAGMGDTRANAFCRRHGYDNGRRIFGLVNNGTLASLMCRGEVEAKAVLKGLQREYNTHLCEGP